MHSNPVSDRATATARIALLSAEASAPEPIRRLSPLASLLVVLLSSLAGWAAIGAIIVSLLK
jgi:hypothetical protein